MKKRLVVALAVVSISATATAAIAGMAAATGINGSWHDITAIANHRIGTTGYNGYYADDLGRTCVFCHTPHNARATAGNELTPLWNHADNNYTKPMKAYAWVAPTNKGIAMAADPLIGPSRLCMACHDGSTAVDAHGSANGNGYMQTGSTPMSAVYTDGLHTEAKRYITDLQVTHPIGFKYDDAVAARPGELVDKESGFITGPLPSDFNTWIRTNNGAASGTAITTSAKKIKDTLYGEGYMTCATCHDVHNTVNAVPDSGHQYNYFIYAKEEGSAICLSCHVK